MAEKICNLNKMGGGMSQCVELLSFTNTTLSTTLGLNDSLSNYSFVLLVVMPSQDNNKQVLSSTIFPVSVFKTIKGIQADYMNASYNAYVGYKNDTTVEGNVNVSSRKGVLYGIK